MEKILTQPPSSVYPMLLQHFLNQQQQQCHTVSAYQIYPLILLGLQQSLKNLQNSPCYKNLEFKLQKNCNPKMIQTLSIMQLKQTLIQQLVDCHITLRKSLKEHILQSASSQNVIFPLQYEKPYLFEKQIQCLLPAVMKQSLEKLRLRRPPQHAYNFLQIEWKKNAIDLIISKTKDNKEGLIKLKAALQQQAKNQIPAENKIIKRQQHKQEALNPEILHDLKQFKSSLAKIDGHNFLKVELLKLYNQSGERLKEKDMQISKLLKCVEQFKEIIPSQMSTIEHLTTEKVELEGYIDLIHNQIFKSQEKYRMIEEQLIKLQGQIKGLDCGTTYSKSKGQQYYYLNPQHQKNQIDEKMLVQMIQLQSDLLLGKNQIKKLTDSVIQIIRTSHNYLQDLSATRYYLMKYDKSIYSIIKDLKSFESIQMENILPLKDDSVSFVDSYIQQEMKSSFMSINSELQGDSKLSRLSRLTTQDSLILSSGQDQ